MRALVPLTLAALAAACISSSSSPAPAPPPPPPSAPAAPSALSVRASPTWGRFLVSWSPQGSYDGFQLEYRRGDAAFGPVPGVAGGLLQTSIEVALPDVPEAERLAFRVRATLQGSASAWSEVAEARQGVLPVTGLTASPAAGADGSPGPPITVRWTHPSAIAPQIAVERAVVSILTGAAGPWSRIAAGLEWASDVPPVDGVSCRYRVRRGVDGLWSAWAEAETFYPVLAPIDLRVEPVVGDDGGATAFRLTWTNRSAAATRVEVWRVSDWTGPVATLPPDATSYVDRFPAWSSWSYRLVATVDAIGYLSSRSEVVPAPPFLLAGEPPVQAGSVALPCTYTLVRDGVGRWACVSSSSYSGDAVAWGSPGGGWERRTFPDAAAANLFLALDGRGLPHALRSDQLVAGTLHVWHDGVAWREEDVPLPGLDPAQPWNTWPRAAGFGVTAAGVPIVLLERGGSWSETYGVLTRTADGWVERPIQLRPDVFYFDLQQFAVASDGTAVLFGDLAIDGTPNVCAMALLGLEDADAMIEAIPGTDMACFGGYKGVLLGARTGRVAIGYGLEREDQDYDWFYREHGPAGWSEPELVATQPFSARVIPPGGTLSHDGSGAALFLSWPVYRYAHAQVYKAFARSARGPWRELTLGPGFPDSARVWSGGFLADGRLWLVGNTYEPLPAADAPNRYALYEEL